MNIIAIESLQILFKLVCLRKGNVKNKGLKRSAL
jgi:hypothetical protein